MQQHINEKTTPGASCPVKYAGRDRGSGKTKMSGEEKTP